MLVTVSQTTLSPQIQAVGDSIYLRVWYTADFIAGDGITSVKGGDGQSGFYYNITCSKVNNQVVIPAFTIQSTTDSNPSADFFGQLWVDGAAGKVVFGGAGGWQMPSVYGPTLTYGQLAGYNRVRRLLYPPDTYFTADETIRQILSLGGSQSYAGVGILGRTQLDTAPANALVPIAVGVNSPLITSPLEIINVKTYGAVGDTVVLSDGVVNGTNTVSSASATFTSADINKKVDINQSGATANDINGVSGINNQSGTILTVIDAHTITVSFTAVRTATGLTITYGTDDSVAIAAAALAGESLFFPAGNYCVSSMINTRSNQSYSGAGRGVSILTQIGPTRNAAVANHFPTFRVWDGVHDVTIQGLTIKGTNKQGEQITTIASGYSKAVYTGTGAGGLISNLTVQDCDLSNIWGQGFRGDGDVGDQGPPGGTPTLKNIRILGCNVVNNSDDGLNPSVGGGIEVAGCYLSGNTAGIEFAGSKINFHHNLVTGNRFGGCSIGGLGNPSQGKDNLWSQNIVTRNGVTSGAGTGYGFQIGGNVMYAEISGNIIRENSYQGIGLTDGTPDFASLSRDIRIHHNHIVSNGLTGNGELGLSVGVAGTTIEDNDIYDDAATGYRQAQGIVLQAPNCTVARNHVYSNTTRDYLFSAAAVNTFFQDDYPSSVVTVDATAFSGTVDTNGTAVTWKTGSLFGTFLKAGAIIRINSVDYPIASVAAAPSGTVDTSGASITRVTGTNFDAAWIGKYITITGVNYLISAVADASHLTVSITFGTPGTQTGVAWALRDLVLGSGAVTLTLSGAGAGVQSGVAYTIAPNFIFPAPPLTAGGQLTVLTMSSNTLFPTGVAHRLGAGLVKTIVVPFGILIGSTITVVPTAAFTTDVTGNIAKASTAVVAQALTFTWDGFRWYPSY